MAGKIITPKFTERELIEIDKRVMSGEARNRSDFVRKAVIFRIESERNREILP